MEDLAKLEILDTDKKNQTTSEANKFIHELYKYITFFESHETKEINTAKLNNFKLLVCTTNVFVIQEAFKKIADEMWRYGKLFIYLFHVVSTSEQPILAIHLERLKLNRDYQVADKYLDIFYQQMTPSDVIHTIHDVWKSFPEIEFSLHMTYCRRLLQKKKYKTFKYIVTTEIQFFESCFKEMKKLNSCTISYQFEEPMLPTMLYFLHCYLSSDADEAVCIDTMVSYFMFCDQSCFYEGFYQYLLLLNKHKLPCTKQINNKLFDAEGLNRSYTVGAIIYASVKLKENNDQYKSKNFLKQNLQYLEDISIAIPNVDFKTRYRFSQILCEVLYECYLCKDTRGEQLATKALHSLKFSLLHNTSMAFYRCCGGSVECKIDSGMCYGNYSDRSPLMSPLLRDSSEYRCKEHKKRFVRRIEEENGKCSEECERDSDKLCFFNNSDRHSHFTNYFWIRKHPSKYLCKEHKERFVRMTKKWNDDFNVCKNKRQQLNDATSSKHSSDYKGSDEDYHCILVTLVLVAVDCNKANEFKDFVTTLCQMELNHEVEELCIGILSYSLYIKLIQHNRIHKFVLDINKDIPECSLLTKLTLKVGECLNFKKEVIKDKKRVVYNCFCKVRGVRRNYIYITFDEYREHFKFIKSMEKEEEMGKLVKFLIYVMLLLMSSANGGHHKSAEMKKYLSLKYEYDKAILYLLWCSGDVEINPGPTLRTLRPVPASQKLRAWIWDMCSILLKILKRLPVNSKPKDLWKAKPDNWPCGQPFYDPRNKTRRKKSDIKSDKSPPTDTNLDVKSEKSLPTDKNLNVKSDKILLKCILDLCKELNLDLSQYQEEINAWEDDNKTLLFELHTCRKEIHTINTAIQCLINVKKTCELHHILGQITIGTDFSVHNVNNEKQKGTTDIIRGVAVLLCKISKQIHPMEKSGLIWKTLPIRWKAVVPFYDPHNTKASSEEVKSFVNNLVEYIETENIIIPPEYAALVTAWKQQNMKELCNIYTLYNVAVIKNALEYMQQEGLFKKPAVLDKLKRNGLALSPEWFNGSRASSGICDSTQASTSHQVTVNQSNAQQNSNGQNGSKCDSTGNSGSAQSCRKRSNPTCGMEAAKGKCLNKKRKALQENSGMKKMQQKNSSDNATPLDIQYTSQLTDHSSLIPQTPVVDSLTQVLNQKHCIESPQEQLGHIAAHDNQTVAVSLIGQAGHIGAQYIGPTESTHEQPDAIVDQTTLVLTGEHQDATVPCCKITASRSTNTYTDQALPENPKNDEELNEILELALDMMDSSNKS